LRTVVGAVGVVVLAAAATVYALAPRESAVEVPTAEVRRQNFIRWVPADGELRAEESTPLQVPGSVRRALRIAWIAPEGTRLEAGDVAVRFDPTELEKAVEDHRSELASNRLQARQRAARASARLEELDREVQTARRELEHAEEFASRDATIFSRVEIIESRIDRRLAEERLEHARQERSREEDLADAELEILEIERRKIEGDLESALDTLEALELRAPKTGHLIYRRRRGQPPQVGNTVFAGQTVAEIPHEGPMEVEAYVLEADAGGLEVGLPARVYPESHPGVVYAAEVARVDSVATRRFQASPVQYFAATLSLDEIDPEVMKPGVGVRVEILVDDLDDALTVPRQALFDREGAQVVRRRSGAGFEEVPVNVLAAGRGRMAIEGDLEPGDRVALTDPTRTRRGKGEQGEDGEDGPPDGTAAVPTGEAGSGTMGGGR
jgi:multidrug efflux pump subunit AcrA (membrane-fusion protein)